MPAGVPDRYRIAAITEVDLLDPPPALADRSGDLLVLVRSGALPLGMVLAAAGEVAEPAALQRLIAERVELGAAGPAAAVNERLARSAADGPPISVVLCTRDRAEALARCIDSVLASRYPELEVVVVDNAPATDVTRQVVAAAQAGLAGRTDRRVRYELEPRPGLSRARNRGIAAARHELIAFVDDDERVDRWWPAALADEFTDPAVGCVSGLVLPAELETEAQVKFEQFGGHSKGRGFRREVFDAGYLASRQPAVYPLPPFGVGANMAFRRPCLEAIRGFDTALGAGTVTHGCEDTRAFTEVLLAGWTMVYAPAALTWHYHRRELASLRSQLGGYGVGLGAYYTALVLRDPRRLIAILAVLGRALRDIRDPASVRNEGTAELPAEFRGLSLASVLAGPFRYLQARWSAR